MKRATRAIFTLAVLLIAACSGNSTPEPAPAPGRARARENLITYEEIRAHVGTSNLYDLIAELRPRWLHSQGPDTLIGQQGQVQVHMDGNLLGDVEVLRRLSPTGVTSIQFLEPIDAGARYGLNHSHGAIVIATGTRAGPG